MRNRRVRVHRKNFKEEGCVNTWDLNSRNIDALFRSWRMTMTKLEK